MRSYYSLKIKTSSSVENRLKSTDEDPLDFSHDGNTAVDRADNKCTYESASQVNDELNDAHHVIVEIQQNTS